MGEKVTFYCPKCWKEIPNITIECPHCGVTIASADADTFLGKLIGALRHPVPSKAALAAQILGQLGNPLAIEPLLAALNQVRDPEIQEAIIRSLGQLKDTRAVDVLSHILIDSETFLTLRIAATQALGEIGGARAIASLQNAAERNERAVSLEARAALERMGMLAKQ